MGISGNGYLQGCNVPRHTLCSQIDEVLSKDSAEELDKGNNPGPMTEIQFWKAKCENLESLYDQMKENTTKKMASILNITDSAYYPSFKQKILTFSEQFFHIFPVQINVQECLKRFE